jgi:hypothetical protein
MGKTEQPLVQQQRKLNCLEPRQRVVSRKDGPKLLLEQLPRLEPFPIVPEGTGDREFDVSVLQFLADTERWRTKNPDLDSRKSHRNLGQEG